MSKYTTTKIVEPKNIMKVVADPFYKDHMELSCENICFDKYEITKERKHVRIEQPVHVALAILHESKLLLLKFIYWLHEHLRPNSYSLVYADTDSICIGI